MKKCLAVIILILSGMVARAQTLTLNDITNLASLNNAQAHASLTLQRPFTESYSEQIDGREVDHYRGNTPASKAETVTIGYQGLSTDGTVLRTVTYIATDVKYVIKLIAQAKGINLKEEFRGADTNSNIYMFDNFLYTVHIYIANDRSRGSIVVRQNELK